MRDVVRGMLPFLDNAQLEELQYVLRQALQEKTVVENDPMDDEQRGWKTKGSLICSLLRNG